MKTIDYFGLRIRPIRKPKIGNKIYYIVNKKTQVYEPCIVKSGCFLDPTYHRVSNFWTWLNLANNKEESGYGGFVEIFECSEQKEIEGE